MNKKAALVVLAVAAVFAFFGGILLYRQRVVSQAEIPRIKELLREIEKNSGVDFSRPRPDFVWHNEPSDTENGEIIKRQTAKGYKIEARNLPAKNRAEEKIYNYLRSLGFFTDAYNIATGTVRDEASYKKDRTVCVVNWALDNAETDETEDKIPMTVSLEIICGLINK
jgi:hypothetical protein